MSDPSQFFQAFLDMVSGGRRRGAKPDERQPLYVALARVLAAAARADGPINRNEENRIKALVALLRPPLTVRELNSLMLDLDEPVGEAVWAELLPPLRERAKRSHEATFVVARVRDLLEVDGPLNDAERDALGRVEVAMGLVSEAPSVATATSLRPGGIVLEHVVAAMQRMADRQAEQLREVDAPLEKLCVFAAAAAYVLRDADPLTVARSVGPVLTRLFGVSESAAGYVAERAAEAASETAAAVGGDHGWSEGAIAADMEEWGSGIELRALLQVLDSAATTSRRGGVRGRVTGLREALGL